MSGAYKIPALGVVLIAALLAGCATQPARQTPPASVPPQSAPQPAAQNLEGREFRVDPAASLLTIRVYKGGALARAGHNHVIASHSLNGVVRVPEDPTHASFDVHLPVTELVVDEDELRAQEGSADFPPGVPEDAKAGTKKNMLGPALLEAERYPEIVLQSEAIQRGAEGLEAQVRVVVRDRASSVVVPVKYDVNGNELTAQGELPLKQTDLGLTPFSLFGGALRVLDEIKVRFKLVARAE
jgi:polyisoprenoid-binding protein YceI